MQTTTFSGFPPETQRFLADLTLNNNRDWFTAHREDYETYYLAPALAFIADIGPRLIAEVSPDTQFEPRINGSLFRINRDVRFSKDKSPYKTHLDMWFWQGTQKGWDSPGFFFRMLQGELIVGAGMHRFSPEQAKAFRAAVLDDESGIALEALRGRLDALGYDSGERSKSLPRGIDPAHPRAELTKLMGLISTHRVPVPPEATSPAFIDYCAGHFQTMNPINDWLKTYLI